MIEAAVALILLLVTHLAFAIGWRKPPLEFDGERTFRASTFAALFVLLCGVGILVMLWSTSLVGVARDPTQRRMWLEMGAVAALWHIFMVLIWRFRIVVGEEAIRKRIVFTTECRWSEIARVEMMGSKDYRLVLFSANGKRFDLISDIDDLKACVALVHAKLPPDVAMSPEAHHYLYGCDPEVTMRKRVAAAATRLRARLRARRGKPNGG